MSAAVKRGLICLGLLFLGWSNALGVITNIREGSDAVAAFNAVFVVLSALWLHEELKGRDR